MAHGLPSWYRYRYLLPASNDLELGQMLLVGHYAGVPTIVAVDADGNIIGVMKGQYDSDLQTIAVDAQGRMLAVLTDPEDAAGNPTYMGGAELAARLGSPAVFDRRGQMLWMDDFENGISKWASVTTGTGATVTPWISNYRSKGCAARFYSSATNGEATGLERYQPYNLTPTVGLEASVILPSNDADFKLVVKAVKGSSYYHAYVYYSIGNNTLYYRDVDGNDVALTPSIDVYLGGVGFSNMKLVVDLDAADYVRFVMNGVEFDMAGIDIQPGVSVSAPYVYTGLFIATQSSSQVAAIVDDAIITQNEPT